MRAHPERAAKRTREMELAEAGDAGELLKPQVIGEMRLDVVHHASCPVRRQRFIAGRRPRIPASIQLQDALQHGVTQGFEIKLLAGQAQIQAGFVRSRELTNAQVATVISPATIARLENDTAIEALIHETGREHHLQEARRAFAGGDVPTHRVERTAAPQPGTDLFAAYR